ADFLPHDHSEAIGHFTEAERAVDRVVIGGADDVEARGAYGPRLLGERRAAVRRGFAVGVHVDPDLASRHAQGRRCSVVADFPHAGPFAYVSWTPTRTLSLRDATQ